MIAPASAEPVSRSVPHALEFIRRVDLPEAPRLEGAVGTADDAFLAVAATLLGAALAVLAALQPGIAARVAAFRNEYIRTLPDL